MSENMGAHKAPKAIIEQASMSEVSAEDAAAAEEEARAAFGAGANESERTGAFDAARNRHGSGSFQDATIGFFEGVGRAAWGYADAHPHAVLYGLLGFVLAVLILVIGLWDTIVIAVFVTVGVIIGQTIDGDNAAVNFISRILNGRK